MSDGPFPFLRGTYFRWAKTIERLCPEFKGAPKVLAVGDIHIENFGTWRNVEQRLVWGINDFDEAARMPYAFDLVRLVTSARLATVEGSREDDRAKPFSTVIGAVLKARGRRCSISSRPG